MYLSLVDEFDGEASHGWCQREIHRKTCVGGRVAVGAGRRSVNEITKLSARTIARKNDK